MAREGSVSNSTSEHQTTGVVLSDNAREHVNTRTQADYRKKNDECIVKVHFEDQPSLTIYGKFV